MTVLVMWSNSNSLISQGEENPLGLWKETFTQFQDINAKGVFA